MGVALILLASALGAAVAGFVSPMAGTAAAPVAFFAFLVGAAVAFIAGLTRGEY